ncbi:MAG TPA: DAHL domain-containing protein [Burkholderiales bacterium]|nr:DAHL domain-containing protein [Burkholderiales bacterium]
MSAAESSTATDGGTDARARRRRAAVLVVCAVLAALFVFLHVRAQDSAVQREIQVLSQLVTVRSIDARWDAAIFRARTGTGPGEPVVQSTDLMRIQRALDLAQAHALSNALRSSAQDLRKAYGEKADLVTRLQQAATDSRQALESAMRADSAVSALVRSAWRDFPQHDRLVAAENLVARVLAEAQQYHYAATPSHRAALAGYAADLPRAHSLPRAVEAGLVRLESDVHRLLLLKPLEELLAQRLAVLDTGTGVSALAETFERSLGEAMTRRNHYRLALLVYTTALVLLLAYFGARAAARQRWLAARCTQAEEALAELQARERTREESGANARAGIEAGNVRLMRRP